MADAAARAEERVEVVRDDTAGRLALAADFYDAASGRFGQYGHAELSFMRWSAARGVLEPESSDRAGSAWWRSVNAVLLRDKIEAGLLADDGSGVPSSHSVQCWIDFIREPSPTRWYRAHNASIVAGYLKYEDLAEQELKAERFMMNVALLRVIYTHAMLADPRLALGPLAFPGPRLVDPRHRSVKWFLDLARSFPKNYPIVGSVEEVVFAEHALARMLDYGLIAPRLPALYEFAAEQLQESRLTSLLDDGVPAYVWAHADREVWFIGNTGPHLRAIARVTGVRLRWAPSPYRRRLRKVRDG